ncbi:hypothetical protein [Pseudacidovorax intermedius]|uniref:hypothetical protein n=1 Tax=Pseudacidovorax intermedius TaxID=433924 RepID=UPI00034D964A|nr:hypothetical protein [Pseudacidovorax intermedius]
MPDIRDLALWALLALAVAGWGVGCAERTRAGALTMQLEAVTGQRDAARQGLAELNGAVTRQKAEAAATLASLNASVLAQQKRIDAAAAAQEKTDAKNLDDISRLRVELRAARLRAGAGEAGGRGSGGGGAPGAAGAGTGDRAGGRAQGARLFPDPEAAADDDAYEADRVNLAYASCRGVLFERPYNSPVSPELRINWLPEPNRIPVLAPTNETVGDPHLPNQ